LCDRDEDFRDVDDFLDADFLDDDFLDADFLEPVFLDVDFLDDDFFDDFPFLGTLAPALRASDSPIAIACFLLFTFLPDPLRKVPCLRSCMVFSTFD